MGDWIFKENEVSRYRGGPFTNVNESYQWNGEKWEYQKRSEDWAPGGMVLTGEPEIDEVPLKPINTQQAAKLLEIYGVAPGVISLNKVITIPPRRLEQLALNK